MTDARRVSNTLEPPQGAPARDSASQRFVENLAQLQQERSNSSLAGLRQAALARFQELGLPGRRHEEWRFTNAAPIVEQKYSLPQGAPEDRVDHKTVAAVAEELLGSSLLTRLVFVDGQFAPGLSSREALPVGVVVTNLAEALETHQPLVEANLAQYAGYRDAAFTALNTAAMEDGAFIWVPRGRVVEDPIYLLFISSAAATHGAPVVSHPRSLVLAEDGSQVSIVEVYAGLGHGLTNAVTEVVAGENAVVDHYKVQRDTSRGFHIATMQVLMRRATVFSSQSITFGGKLVRNDVRSMLDGEGAECTLNGVYLGTGDQVIDNHTAIDHARPNCASHEVYHGVLDARSQGVFNGKILVRPHAQKTDAKQTNRTLLLSDSATIDTKPQLEIFADDVRCTHGATIGRLDDEAIFYLRSRGIPHEAASGLLTFAFANEIVERVQIEGLRESLEKQIFAWLSNVRGKMPG